MQDRCLSRSPVRINPDLNPRLVDPNAGIEGLHRRFALMGNPDLRTLLLTDLSSETGKDNRVSPRVVERKRGARSEIR